mmetsp:Transcript_18000/g.58757  ORF Transcript_18000/g.58757 Transcript_18000/m.58757 type:complete len:282 (-) Transcript_18000:37-882(-)
MTMLHAAKPRVQQRLRAHRRLRGSPACATSEPVSVPSRYKEVLQLVREWSYEEELPRAEAKLRVRLAGEADTRASTLVLTQAFEDTPDRKPRALVARYVLEALEQPPEGVSLVGELVREKRAEVASVAPSSREGEGFVSEGDAGGASTSGRGEDDDGDAVVATVSLSFAPSTRERFDSLQPPDDAAYLSNMAVARTALRKGVGSAMLRASENLVECVGGAEVYLHVRMGDAGACAFYAANGYAVQSSDSFMVGLLQGSDARRSLMRKELASFAHGACNMIW